MSRNSAHSADVGVADAAGIGGSEIEIHVVGFCTLGNPLNDSRKDCVVGAYGGVDVGDVPRSWIDNVRDLIYAAGLEVVKSS